ncbi:MAG: PQQ-binding-like beta-propeller repeat protein [Planctomycetes bacterium]|nr:PQQ-binding-like beta-propeller repeat protein [Planctomycetota bacterium]
MKQQNEAGTDVRYQSAVGMAIVTAVFCVFIAALITVNVSHMKIGDPARSAELEKMKEQSKAYPADEALTETIRQLDTELRRDQFARLYFLKSGTILLAVTAALLAGSVIYAGSLRSSLPKLEPQGDLKTRQIRHASTTRLAFSLGLVCLCGMGLFWAMRPPIFVDKQGLKEGAVSRYASMEEAKSQWSTFRGPGALGTANFNDIPDTWDGNTGQNILWKTPIPLPGHNSPVVWDNRIFLTGATANKQQVYCYDAESGELLWQQDVSIPANPARGDMDVMEDTGYAAPTAVTDGRRVCAIFAGGDIGCFTVDGKPLWEKHLGIPESMYGFSASLAWFENRVIIQWDVGYEDTDSRFIALDWQTGDTVWRTKRPVPNSWSSPTVVNIDGAYRVITNASPFTIVYDAKTGTELYRVECVSGDVASTPIVSDEKIFTIEPYNKLVAVSTDESLPAGDERLRIVWENESEMPDICSPVSNEKFIWTLTTQGDLSCFDVTDGHEVYTQSLKLNFQASPTLVGQTLYLLSDKGTMVLIEAGVEYKEISRSELGEGCFASPAYQEGRMYIRAENSLYAIGND